MKYKVLVSLLVLASALTTIAQDPQKPPSNPGMNMDEMNKRGDHVMGFDHTKTTHHFRLRPDGGAIEITANSNTDNESRDQIRTHLGHIAQMFAEGNFNAPMLIHEQVPPGVPIMKELKGEIEYKFEATKRGATIRIKTSNTRALEAIHSFLRFQIKEHQTGDPTEVER